MAYPSIQIVSYMHNHDAENVSVGMIGTTITSPGRGPSPRQVAKYPQKALTSRECDIPGGIPDIPWGMSLGRLGYVGYVAPPGYVGTYQVCRLFPIPRLRHIRHTRDIPEVLCRVCRGYVGYVGVSGMSGMSQASIVATPMAPPMTWVCERFYEGVGASDGGV